MSSQQAASMSGGRRRSAAFSSPGRPDRGWPAVHAAFTYAADGDTITHSIFKQLNSSFVTPFDRADIYNLASDLDDVMDSIEAAADIVVLTGLGTLPAEMAQQVELILRAAQTTAEAMPRLQTMKDLPDYWIEVNRLENEADKLYRRLLSRLFSGEFEALEVMKLKEVADLLEEAADAFEHVANVVETIAVKES